MNKKAQDNPIGMVIMIAIVAIVGAILLTASAQNVGEVINTIAVANDSLGTADNDTSVYLTAYRSITSVVVYNATVIVPAGNYTVVNNVIDPTTGGLSVNVTPASAAIHNYTTYEWNISGTGQPTTYDPSSGGRAVAGLIVLFFALAIAIAMLIPTLRSKVLESIGR